MSPDTIASAAKNLAERASQWDQQRPDPALSIVAQVRSVAATLESFNRLVVTKSPTDTDAAHLLKIEAARLKLIEGERPTWIRLGNELEGLRASVKARVDAAASLIPGADAAELRAALRALPHDQRIALLNDAVKNGDSALLASVSNKHELLTGVSSEHVEKMVDAHRRRAAPTEFADLQRIEDAFSTATTTLGLVSKAITGTKNQRQVAAIMQAAAEAQSAQDAFSTATGGTTP